MSLSTADSIEILQLVARADACATARDADGYAALFTEDGGMSGAMGDVSGKICAQTGGRIGLGRRARRHFAPHAQRRDR